MSKTISITVAILCGFALLGMGKYFMTAAIVPAVGLGGVILCGLGIACLSVAGIACLWGEDASEDTFIQEEARLQQMQDYYEGGCDPLYGRRVDSADMGEN